MTENEDRYHRVEKDEPELRNRRLLYQPPSMVAGTWELNHVPFPLIPRMWWWWERKTSQLPATFSWMQRLATSSQRTSAPMPWLGSPPPKQQPSA